MVVAGVGWPCKDDVSRGTSEEFVFDSDSVVGGEMVMVGKDDASSDRGFGMSLSWVVAVSAVGFVFMAVATAEAEVVAGVIGNSTDLSN